MDDMEIVSALRLALADRVGEERFALWFGAGTRLQLHDGVVTVGAPNRFFRDWLRLSFREEIEAACLATLGTCPPLDFRVDPEACDADAADAELAPQARRKVSARISREEEPWLDVSNGSTRQRFADLESFVTGCSNQVARASAEMVSGQLGAFSPLLIYGPTSVGKTHLLEGIWTAVRKSCRSTAVYLSSEQFTSYYVEAVRGSGLPSFRRKYRGVELLIIDDIQFFRGKRSTLVELLYTIDTLLRQRGQLVFAADRPPAELPELGAELITRLESGMVCGIEPPDYATRLGIVNQMARRFGLNVPQEVQQLIASRFRGHARELSGALCRLQAAARASGHPISLPMAEQSLAELIRHSGRVVRLGDIQKAVCRTFGLEASSLQSGRKSKRISHPRMLAMWLARKHTRAALTEIGQFFGRRSHSTVISAQKRVDGWIAQGSPVEMADATYNVDEAIRRVEGCLRVG